MAGFLTTVPYTPPPWAAKLRGLQPPPTLVRLACVPTPQHRVAAPGLPPGVELWLKRDDLTGCELSGNKVRKLELLLADALASGCDCVATIGGIQSNHCRATAVAARLLGLDAHLLLRTDSAAAEADPGLGGNLLPARLAGAAVHLVTKEEYSRLGAAPLLQALGGALRAQGRRPCLIPLGGSSALGTLGYLQCVAEIQESAAAAGQQPPSHVALACGSGGTAAGVALGVALAGLPTKVVAFGVCDSPQYFYDHIDALFAQLGAPGGLRARDCLRLVQARGGGYAVSREAELDSVAAFGAATGVALDPVYTGKAYHGLLTDMRQRPEEYPPGSQVMFLHTGGLLGAYGEQPQLLAAMGRLGGLRAGRLAVPS